MSKCIIQIPCYNEEATLPVTLGDLPRTLAGVDTVEWLVVDDGSTDGSAEAARAHGADHVVRLSQHLGLAAAFMAGIENCLQLGADVIVNTDADNQYVAADIQKLIMPVLEGRADLVIGARSIDSIAHFSKTKKVLQRLGSAVVRLVSATRVADAPSGFRAYSRRAAMSTHVFHSYTYTLETLIQAGRNGLSVVSIPVRTNRDLRSSRLMESTASYVARSGATILRVAVLYRPFRFFGILGALVLLGGILLGLRFLYLLAVGGGRGHVQSLILCAVLLVVGALLGLVAIVSDLIAVNRRLLEGIDYRLKAHDLCHARDDPKG